LTIKPPILRHGDTIGIVTLGSPLDASVINDRVSILQNLGFRVVLGNHVYASSGYLAGTDQERASDLMSMFENTDVKLILPSRGGVGVAGIIPYLDFQMIASNPKIISGYSDLTILLNVLYQYANLITFHSLLLIDFKPETPVYNFEQFYAATASSVYPRVIQNPPDIPITSKVRGNVYGPLVGGNLTSFIDCLGTPYEIDTKGKILLIEETHEPINTVYRYINHLKLAGKLDDCIGIIMGQCTGCTVSYGKSYDDLINEVLVPLGKPLISNAATGHGVYKAAFPIGAQINLNADAGTITVLEATVS
jgi:muramoyltetrapeptide carboxypeptidase